jgi:hypothetical protein
MPTAPDVEDPPTRSRERVSRAGRRRARSRSGSPAAAPAIAFAEFADEFDGANVDGPIIDVEQVVGRVFVDGRSPSELGV